MAGARFSTGFARGDADLRIDKVGEAWILMGVHCGDAKFLFDFHYVSYFSHFFPWLMGIWITGVFDFYNRVGEYDYKEG